MAQINLSYFEIAQMFGLQFIGCYEHIVGEPEYFYKFRLHDHNFVHGDLGCKTEDEMKEQAGKAVLLAIGDVASRMME